MMKIKDVESNYVSHNAKALVTGSVITPQVEGTIYDVYVGKNLGDMQVTNVFEYNNNYYFTVKCKVCGIEYSTVVHSFINKGSSIKHSNLCEKIKVNSQNSINNLEIKGILVTNNKLSYFIKCDDCGFETVIPCSLINDLEFNCKHRSLRQSETVVEEKAEVENTVGNSDQGDNKVIQIQSINKSKYIDYVGTDVGDMHIQSVFTIVKGKQYRTLASVCCNVCGVERITGVPSLINKNLGTKHGKACNKALNRNKNTSSVSEVKIKDDASISVSGVEVKDDVTQSTIGTVDNSVIVNEVHNNMNMFSVYEQKVGSVVEDMTITDCFVSNKKLYYTLKCNKCGAVHDALCMLVLYKQLGCSHGKSCKSGTVKEQKGLKETLERKVQDYDEASKVQKEKASFRKKKNEDLYNNYIGSVVNGGIKIVSMVSYGNEFYYYGFCSICGEALSYKCKDVLYHGAGKEHTHYCMSSSK